MPGTIPLYKHARRIALSISNKLQPQVISSGGTWDETGFARRKNLFTSVSSNRNEEMVSGLIRLMRYTERGTDSYQLEKPGPPVLSHVSLVNPSIELHRDRRFGDVCGDSGQVKSALWMCEDHFEPGPLRAGNKCYLVSIEFISKDRFSYREQLNTWSMRALTRF